MKLTHSESYSIPFGPHLCWSVRMGKGAAKNVREREEANVEKAIEKTAPEFSDMNQE